jgi:hypothetical protein
MDNSTQQQPVEFTCDKNGSFTRNKVVANHPEALYSLHKFSYISNDLKMLPHRDGMEQDVQELISMMISRFAL